MIGNKKTWFWKLWRWFLLLFLIMLAIRFFTGSRSLAGDQAWLGELSSDFFSSVANLRKNYAGEKMQSSLPDHSTQASATDFQKYEKTATVRSRTTRFEQDSALIRQKTHDYQGVIQYEQNTGNEGARQIHLMIGILPRQFDSFYETLLSIGKIRFREITKIDKTNEFRQLNGRKASLEKNLSSLNELKSKGGAISDYVQLHEKILELENQLQELGVELGNFDQENEFCTVKFSLYESEPEPVAGYGQIILTALTWTIQHYALLMLGLLMMSGFVFVFILIIEKIRGLTGGESRIK